MMRKKKQKFQDVLDIENQMNFSGTGKRKRTLQNHDDGSENKKKRRKINPDDIMNENKKLKKQLKLLKQKYIQKQKQQEREISEQELKNRIIDLTNEKTLLENSNNILKKQVTFWKAREEHWSNEIDELHHKSSSLLNENIILKSQLNNPGNPNIDNQNFDNNTLLKTKIEELTNKINMIEKEKTDQINQMRNIFELEQNNYIKNRNNLIVEMQDDISNLQFVHNHQKQIIERLKTENNLLKSENNNLISTSNELDLLYHAEKQQSLDFQNKIRSMQILDKLKKEKYKEDMMRSRK
eukprot:TRINITY_DN2814_c0_g1_i1.p1 TRINITY_DN2814_c0_g1~~TRINITY_DN2814_c0_g1_i1.p1  ORF type:complete len:296 (-),score=94.01 TRINITY_DN2814_c0_g1_i1:45-932(-)